MLPVSSGRCPWGPSDCYGSLSRSASWSRKSGSIAELPVRAGTAHPAQNLPATDETTVNGDNCNGHFSDSRGRPRQRAELLRPGGGLAGRPGPADPLQGTAPLPAGATEATQYPQG